MALATAFRVSELQALSVAKECLRFNVDRSVSLVTSPGFVAKNKRPNAGSQTCRLVPLQEDPNLCPVLLLREYLEKSQQFRRNRVQLFLPIKSSTEKATPQLLSTWIRRVIAAAYDWQVNWLAGDESLGETHQSGNRKRVPDQLSGSPISSALPSTSLGAALLFCTPGGVPRCLPQSDVRSTSASTPSNTEEIGNVCAECPAGGKTGRPGQHASTHGRSAHEVRAITASLALHRGAALGDIIRAVGWSSSNAFAESYLRQMSDLSAEAEAPHVRLPGMPN